MPAKARKTSNKILTPVFAYEFGIHDGGIEYYPSQPPDGVLCPNCESPIDPSYANNDVKVPARYEMMATYDGHRLVHRRFRQFCLDRGYRDVEFVPADKKGNYFDFRPQRILEVDQEKSELRLIDFCEICNWYAGVHIGRSEVFYKNIDRPIAEGIYRSDMLFAYGREKSPIIIVAIETARAIYEAGFRHVAYSSIPGERAMLRPK